ncbi:unnamed protein product [Brassicogethes aeneus]|uniref:RAD3-like helicase DEAD domain-containing protein n=1 Tax=Brassicogethes aeneus TaxID=1431903 RepID=A0A9P0B109_BRAAE|nr:unnamed protein product [Brassicogethes aeneus]
MCIHLEVMKEQSNFARTQMCRLKVKTSSYHFYNRVECKKEVPAVSEIPVMDCPYYMAWEIQKEADIFMPVRKSLGIVLSKNFVILDEAHIIERAIPEDR